MPDPSQPLNNARHEAFAVAWAASRSANGAYVTAGYKPDKCGRNVLRLTENDRIKARRTWLQKQSATASTLTQQEKREILAGIARAAQPLERIAAIKADNDLAGDGAEAVMHITITKAWK